MRARSPRGQREGEAVRVLAPPTEDGGDGGLGGRRLLVRPAVILAAAALVAGLGFAYGYTVGRDRGRAEAAGTSPSVTAVAPSEGPSSDSSTATPPGTTGAAPSMTPGPAPLTVVRALPANRRLPEGSTEFLDPNLVRDLAIDPSGLIWTAGPGGVVRWNPGTGASTRFTLPGGTGPVAASLSAVGASNDVWIGSGYGLFHWDGTEWAGRRFTGIDDGSRLTITALAAVGDGSAWVAAVEWSGAHEMPEARLFRLEGGRSAATAQGLAVPGYVRQLSTAKDGALWVLTGGVLWRRGADGDWTEVTATARSWIHSFSPDPGGGVWFATEDGVHHWQGGVAERVLDTTADETTGGDPEWVVVGADGVPWVARSRWSEEGPVQQLVRLDDMRAYPVPIPPLTRPVAGHDGTLWMGTESGLTGFDGEAWSTLRLDDAAPVRWLDSMAVDGDDVLWVAGAGGLATWDGEGWTVQDRAAGEWAETWGWGPPRTWVASSLEGTLWSGVECRPHVRRGSEWVLDDAPPGFEATDCRSSVRVVGPDDSLRMLIQGWEGPHVFAHDGTAWIDRYDIDRPEWIEALAVADDGTLWAAGAGIHLFGDGRWDTALGGAQLTSVAISGDGSVWAAPACPDCVAVWVGEGALWHLADGVWTQEFVPFAAASLVAASDGAIWAVGAEADGRTAVFRQVPGGRFDRVATETPGGVLVADRAGGVWVGDPGRLLHIRP